MSRRSLYKSGRAQTVLYGPKSDTTVAHWRLDWFDLSTTRDEDTGSDAPQKSHPFRVKTWTKVSDDAYVKEDDWVEGDTFQLVNQMQATADELALKEASEQPATSASVPPSGPASAPTSAPASASPSVAPSASPSAAPSESPSVAPSESPSRSTSEAPMKTEE